MMSACKSSMNKIASPNDVDFVWVRVGKTDHPAFIVKKHDPQRPGQTLVRWSSTRKTEWIDDANINKEELPKRKRTQVSQALTSTLSSTSSPSATKRRSRKSIPTTVKKCKTALFTSKTERKMENSASELANSQCENTRELQIKKSSALEAEDSSDKEDNDNDSSSDFEEDLPLAKLAEQSADGNDLPLIQWLKEKNHPVEAKVAAEAAEAAAFPASSAEAAVPTNKTRQVSRSPDQKKTTTNMSGRRGRPPSQLKRDFMPKVVTDEETFSTIDNAHQEDLSNNSDGKYSLRSSAYLQNLAEICFTILEDRRWRVGQSLEPLFRWEDGEDLSIVTALSRQYIPPPSKPQNWTCKCLLCRDKKEAPPIATFTPHEVPNDVELPPEKDSDDVRALYLYCRLFYRKGPWFRLDDVYSRYYAPKRVGLKIQNTEETKDSTQNNIQPSRGCSERTSEPENQKLRKPSCILDKQMIQQHLQHSIPRLFSDLSNLMDRGFIRFFDDEIECGKTVGVTLLTADERTAVLLKLGGCNKKRPGPQNKTNKTVDRNEIWAQMRQQQTIYASQAAEKSSRVLPVQRHVEKIMLEKLARTIVMSCSSNQYIPAAIMRSTIQEILDSIQTTLETIFQSTKRQTTHTCFRLREMPTRTLQRCVRLLLCAAAGPAEMRGDGSNGWRSIRELSPGNLPFAGLLAPPTVHTFHQIQYPGLSHRFGLRSACFMNAYVHLPIEKEIKQSPHILREQIFMSRADFHRWELSVEIRANIDYLINVNEMLRYEKRQKELGKSSSQSSNECTICSVDFLDVQTKEGRQHLWTKFLDASEGHATCACDKLDALESNVRCHMENLEYECEKVICIIGLLLTSLIAMHCRDRQENQTSVYPFRPWLRHLTWQGCLAYVLWDIIPFFEKKGFYKCAINALGVLIYGESICSFNFFHRSIHSEPCLSLVLLSRRVKGKAFERLIVDLTHMHRMEHRNDDQDRKKEKTAAYQADLVSACENIIRDLSPKSGIGFSAIRSIARRLKRPLSETLSPADNLEARVLGLRFENFDCTTAGNTIAKYSDWTPVTDFFLANSLESEKAVAGSRCAYVGYEDDEKNGRISTSSLTVEELALELYGAGTSPEIQENPGNTKGGWKGWHNEGGHIRALFRILCSAPVLGMDWGCCRFSEDERSLGDFATIYVSPYQGAPFDLHVGHELHHDCSKAGKLTSSSYSFYSRRSSTIDAFLSKLRKLEGQDLCDLVYDAIMSRLHFMTETGQNDPVVERDLMNLKTFSAIAAGFGGAQLAAIFRCMFFDYRHYSGGLPDLQMLRAFYSDCSDREDENAFVDLSEWIGESFSNEYLSSLDAQRASSIFSDDEFLACSKAGDSGVILNRGGRSMNTNLSPRGTLIAKMLQSPPERLQLTHNGRAVKVECMLVEVKSSNDRLDARQEDWLNILDRFGNARVCKFFDNKSGAKKRKRG